MAIYEARAPEYWDARGRTSQRVGRREPLTGEEDLQFLLDGELEATSDDDLFPWEGGFSSDEEEEEEEGDEGYPPAKRLRMWWDNGSDAKRMKPQRASGSDDEPVGGSVMGTPGMMMKAVTARRLGSTSVGLVVVAPPFVLLFLSNRFLPSMTRCSGGDGGVDGGDDDDDDGDDVPLDDDGDGVDFPLPGRADSCPPESSFSLVFSAPRGGL
ncbi:hypothetical protein QYE76_010358 [Lolium multiflorum]|uniref:Uncharacterized protein n=1 Tax=Lolium multiflorum TaxID=4521 RepID=A0AAD8X224_LOLMU|nr:hypothetical protein QYE76_010358 [Lolium multiflorum]